MDNLENDKSNKFKSFITNMLNKKNIKIIILLILFTIAVIIFLSVDGSSKNTVNTSTNEKNNRYLSTLDYCYELENRLESVLSQIKGAGQVKVMLTVDGSPELIYASDTDTKTSSNSSGTTTSTSSSSPIIITNNGGSGALVLTENLPMVKGVIVVSSGAENIGIKLDILQAVSKLLDISTDKISVLKGV